MPASPQHPLALGTSREPRGKVGALPIIFICGLCSGLWPSVAVFDSAVAVDSIRAMVMTLAAVAENLVVASEERHFLMG